MTQWIRDDNGDVIGVADNDPRVAAFNNPNDVSAQIQSRLASQGYYQSPEGWAIVGGGNGPYGGSPRILLDKSGKQPPADILSKFPMASPQEQQSSLQTNAAYDASNKGGEGADMLQALGTAAGAYFGGSALGGLLSGGAATAPAAGASGAFDMGGTAGTLGAGASGASPVAAAIGEQVAPATLSSGTAAISPAAAAAGGSAAGGGIGAGTALSGAGLAASALGGGSGNIDVNGNPLGTGTGGVDYSNTTQGLQNQGVLDANGNLIPSPTATSGGFTGPTGPGSALSRVLDGSASPADYASVLGAGGAALLGAVGSSQQQSALNSLNQQYLGMGQPSRDRYNASFQPGFTMANDPGYTDAIAQTAKASANALSVNGNPGQSPNAQIQNNMDIYSKTAYPALQSYRNQNAATSGIGSFSAAAPATAQAAIGAGSNVYNAIGSGISSITNPPMTLSQYLAGQNAGSNIFGAGKI